MSTLSRLALALLFTTLGTPALAAGEPSIDVGALLYAHWGYDMKPTPYVGYVDGDPRPNAFDVDRAYLNFRAKNDDGFSARITTDVRRSDEDRLEVVLKYAYLQVALDEGVKLRFGSAPTPFVGFSEKFWGHRFIAQSFVDQEDVLDSADIGVSALGTHADGLISWAASLVNGEGYGQIDVDHDKAIQARFTVDPVHGELKLPISVFVSKDFYTHSDIDGHTVFVASVGLDQEFVGVWAEFVSDAAGEIKGQGVSTNVVGKVPDLLNVVFRYDKWDPDTTLDNDAHTTLRGGITKDFAKMISAGLTFEQTIFEADPDQPTKGLFIRMKAGF